MGLALAIPGLVLDRQLISARYAALYDRARIEGLYEVTLEANQRPAAAGRARRRSWRRYADCSAARDAALASADPGTGSAGRRR